jgi:DNA-directed RNA polymerase specialized sigma24 family protein
MLLALLAVLAAAVAVAMDDPLALVRRALAGDGPSLRALVRRLVPVIQARTDVFLAARPGRRIGPHGVDDLVQDVWLALIKDGGRLLLAWDPARGMTLEGYVGLVTKRELWGRVRQETAGKRGSGLRAVDLADVEPAGSHDVEGEAIGRDLARSLADHLEQALPERGRLVMRCLYTDGCSPAEVADVLGVNLQVVYNWQHKIRQLAHAFLSDAAAV